MSRAFRFVLLAVVCFGIGHAFAAGSPQPQLSLRPVTLSAEDRDALGRLAYAEAGNQGASGLAGIVFTVLNRLASRRFGNDVQAVIEASGQFEPVTRVGGRWRDLPPLTQMQSSAFGTILDLIMDGHIIDPTKGATFFQNPTVVAAREAAGTVSPSLTNFGGTPPVTVIKDHAFYRQPASSSVAGPGAVTHASRRQTLWLDVKRDSDGIDIVSIAGRSERRVHAKGPSLRSSQTL